MQMKISEYRITGHAFPEALPTYIRRRKGGWVVYQCGDILTHTQGFVQDQARETEEFIAETCWRTARDALLGFVEYTEKYENQHRVSNVGN